MSSRPLPPLALFGLLFCLALPLRAQVTINSGQTDTYATVGVQPVTFNGGTLQAPGSGTYSLGNALTLTNNGGNLDVDGSNSTFSGAIGGVADDLFLENSGGAGGMITLSNSGNNFSAIVEAGGLTVGLQNSAAFGVSTNLVFLTGGATLQSAAAVDIPNDIGLSGANTIDVNGNPTTYSGSIFGNGSLTLQNSGSGATLTLDGNNSYSGGTTVGSGLALDLGGSNPLGTGTASLAGGNTLQIESAGTTLASPLALSGSLTVDTYGNSAYVSGVISGAGNTLTVTDTSGLNTGVLNLSGAGGAWGNTVVNAGTLQMGMAGVMPAGGALTINSGATFDQNGYAQTVASLSGSGTLKVFPTNPGTTQPSLTVNGTANIGSMTLQIAQYSLSGNYTILRATTLSGTFLAIDLPVGYSDSYVYSGNELTLDLMAPSFARPNETLNEQAVAGALNVQNGSNADMTAILTQFAAMAATPGQQEAALDAMSPIAYAALSGVAFAAADVQSEAVSRRMAALQAAFAEPGGYPSCPQGQPSAEDAPYCKSADSGWSTYGSALDKIGRLDGENGAAGFQPGYDFSAWGALAGADYRLTDHLAAGLAAGYVAGSANIDDGVGDLASQSLRVGGYATGRAGAWRGDVSLGGAFDSFTTNRDIDFGSVNRTASASPGGGELNVSADVGRDIEAPFGLLVYPSFLLGYNHLSVGAFAESGAGALDLNVAGQTANSLRQIIDAKLSRPFVADWFLVSPYVSLGWEHEYINQARSIAAEFSTGQGSFAIDTADVSRDGMLAGAGFTMGFTDTVSLRVDYSEDVRSDFAARTLDGNVSVKF